ncbi:hypothetical protein NC652_006415 [Populus alba x Populus x berolinensis]|nr:hypothetical protein NC652_006415 [Populus alba x Populus x berolinensis]
MTMAQFRIWVKTLDADKDGKISKDELADAVRGNGGWFAGWKGKRGVKAADANGNGVIDDSEIDMLAAFAQKHLEMTNAQFRIWVKTLDADKDGKISKDELANAIRGNGGWFAGWKGKRGVKAADANGDGVIDDSEIDMLAAFAQKHLGIIII